METTYKIELAYDGYKHLGFVIESLMTITSIFSKCINTSFSVSFPDFSQLDEHVLGIEIELTSENPLVYDDYKRLSEALYKLSWCCCIHDIENGIKTVIKKEHMPSYNELINIDYCSVL